MNDTDNFRHWIVTLQSGRKVYVVSPELCDNTIALSCATDWVRSTYPVRYDNDKAVEVVGFNDRFVFNGLSVERRFAEMWYRIDTMPISDGDMRALVEELYTILTKHFDNFGEVEVIEYLEGRNFGEVEVIEYLECRGELYDIERERERLEQELLLEYGGVPF